MKKALFLLVLLLPRVQSPSFAAQVPSITSTTKKAIRATLKVRGVFSPRGFFNIEVRLYHLQGLKRYRFDLKDSLAILDFKPGVSISSSSLRNVMVMAGYQPGPVKIEEIPVSQMNDRGRGWLAPPKIDSHWAFIRWLELNF